MGEVFTREQAKASDERLYGLMFDEVRARSLVAARMDGVHRAADDDYKRRYDRRSGWKLSHQEAVDKLRARIDGSALGHRSVDVKALENYAAAKAAHDAAVVAVAVQEREWEDHGMWDRYAIVPAGHIHKEMGCFTLRQDTDVRWAYFVSGDSVEEAIEVYGDALCSHCYPDAPVDKTYSTIAVDADGNPLTRAQAQEVKDARAAEKAAREAAKNANAVIDPVYGDVLYKTERGATNDIASRLKDMRWYEFKHPDQDKWEAFVERVVAALAAKRGVDPAELRKEFDARADKAFAAATRKSWKELRADCARGFYTPSMVDMNCSTVRYGASIGEELVFARQD